MVAVIRGKGKGQAVAFRADMDALPVTEQTGCDFTSEHVGCMHACGHDGHVTVLLGFAKYLQEHKDELENDVVLIFQPAEEGPGGAQLLVDAGLLKTSRPLHHRLSYLPSGASGESGLPQRRHDGKKRGSGCAYLRGKCSRRAAPAGT